MFPELWLGSLPSYSKHIQNRLAYQQDHVRFAELEAKFSARLSDDEEMDLSTYLSSQLIDIQGKVGIISVNGSLVSEEHYRNLWYDEVAYSTISTAVNTLLEDPNVESLVLALASSGGDASGISDLGSFIKEARKVKPIHAWTGQQALSAAYWAASACQTVRASDLGETGSIGVIATFTSYARMLKEEGIDVTIERSGKYKALLHPAETLTEQGQEYLREKVSTLHTYFIENIETSRSKLKSVSRDVWAEGKSYFAKEAIEIGLVDGPVISLGQLISKLNSVNSSANHRGNQSMAKQILLSDEAQAQVALGVPLEQVEHTEVEAPTEPEVKAEAPKKEPEVAPDAEALLAELREAADPLSDFLKAQVKELQTELYQAKLDLSQHQSKVGQLQDVESKLAPIAIEAINRLQIALGQTPSTMTGLPATSLAEQYTAVKSEFDARFKTGRLTQPASDPAQSGRSLAELRLITGAGSK